MISLVVGLGNPGRAYLGTRHNIGFEILSLASHQLDAEMRPPEASYVYGTVRKGGRTIYLAWPTTFMNESGAAVAEIVARFQLEPSNLLVVADDMYLPVGAIRCRSGGSDGGQKGLRSIINLIGSDQFPRLRAGIGQPEGIDATSWVLSPFSRDQKPIVQKSIARAAEAVIFALSHPFDEVMSRYNGNPAPPEA
jgi:PTH1 family peptidyl-tRNA hydrolase